MSLKNWSDGKMEVVIINIFLTVVQANVLVDLCALFVNDNGFAGIWELNN